MRGGESTLPPAKRAAIVRLNVGGKLFDTTKDTLANCNYFLPCFEERLDHAADEDGRLFLDRSGDYFAHLLHFMRTTVSPNWTYVNENKHALIEECRYYGLEYMQHRIRGETSPYDLRPQDRKLKEQEAVAMQNSNADMLIDVFDVEMTAADPEDLQLPLLPAQAARASVKGAREDFLDRIGKLSRGMA